MRLSINWLREFVPYQGDVQTLADRLTMLGLEVEEIRNPFPGVEQILVGHVLECERHPQADKLSVCRVDIGGPEVLTIVCGAPNVAAGQTVAVAPVGSTMPDGLCIKKAKLRGVESCGMICSERELGLSEDHSGIMVLDTGALPQAVPGARFMDVVKLDTEVLEIGITPNRADCLSVLGLAREVALAFDLPLSLPSVHLTESDEDAASVVRIDIADPDLCPVYRARIIRNVTIGPSPAWLRYRLMAVGQRPINNIVDVTNYVMLELGQPEHAFDLARLEGGVIRVDRAGEGDKMATLDGQERTLTSQDLLILDGRKPVALAGVMGGANSEVESSTRDVLLECAVFKPASIRKTARRLGLGSESSYRFERGVDQPGSLFAMNRAAALMAELAGGTILKGYAAAEPKPFSQATLSFRPERARKLLGIPVTDDWCRRTLNGLGCEVSPAHEAWSVSVPSHRLDLEREVDLIEEIGRVWGMDRIPAALPKVAKALDTMARASEEFEFAGVIREWGRGVGLTEAINYSFVGEKDLNLLGLPQEGRVYVANPLSEEQNVLRTAVAPGLLQSLRHNLSQGNTSLRLFEISKAFFQDPGSETKTRELGRLGLLMTGNRAQSAWPHAEEEVDYLDLKGLVEHLLGFLMLPAATYTRTQGHTFLSPCVEVTVAGTPLGVIGRVEPAIADEYHARKPVWLAELDLDALRRLASDVVVKFRELPVFPPVRRDITLVTSPDLAAAVVLDGFRAVRSDLLEVVTLIDVYTPEGSSDRNLTLRLTYRHKGKTLSDKEVDKEHGRITASVLKSLPVRQQ